MKQCGSCTPSVRRTPTITLLELVTVMVAPAMRGSSASRWLLPFRSWKARTQMVQVVGVAVAVLVGVLVGVEVVVSVGVGVGGARLRMSTGR